MAHKVQYHKQHTFDAAAIDAGEPGDLLNSVLQMEKDNADVDYATVSPSLGTDADGNIVANLSVTARKDAGEGPDFTVPNDALTQAVADAGIETAQSNADDHAKIIEQ